MIKSITVRNYLNKEITLELARPEKSGLIVASAEGLGPTKAFINITDISIGDGGIFNSSRLDKRNIVLKLYFLQSVTESIEDIRQKTYVYFPVKKKVYLAIATDNHTLHTEGYIESNEPDIFSSSEGCQISIICPTPFFYSTENVTTSFSGIESAFSFPFSNNSLTMPLLKMGELRNRTEQIITYDGNSEIGMSVHIHASGEARNITILNVLSGDKMILNTDKLSSILDAPKIPYPYYCIGTNEEKTLVDYSAHFANGFIKLYDNGDGSLTVRPSGGGVVNFTEDMRLYLTAPASSYESSLFRLPDRSYTFSCCPEGGSSSTYYVELHTLDEKHNVINTYIDTGSGVTFETSTYVEIFICLKEGLAMQPATGGLNFIPKFVAQGASRLTVGDTIVINTMRGDKNITLLRDGVATNILNCLEKGSKWFTLLKGDNIFSYDAEVGASNLQFYIENKVAYDGV